MIFSLIIWLYSINSNYLSISNENKSNKLKAKIGLILIPILLIIIRPLFDLLDGGAISIAAGYTSIKFGVFIYFLFWFCFGIWVYVNRNILSLLNLTITIFLGLSALLIFILLYPSLSGFFGHRTNLPEDNYELVFLSLFKGVNTLLWTYFFIAVLHLFFNKSNRFFNWLVIISYPTYLFHLLPSIIFYRYFDRIRTNSINSFIKYYLCIFYYKYYSLLHSSKVYSNKLDNVRI